MAKKGKKKPRPRYLCGLLLLGMLGLPGCGILDWATGADNPKPAGEEKDLGGSPAGQLAEGLQSTGPLGAGIAVILTTALGYYVGKRRKDKAA